MKKRSVGFGQVAYSLAAITLSTCSVFANAQVSASKYPVLPKITTPKESLGFNLGDDHHMASYSQLEVVLEEAC
jgi:hypothetical protein